jgi:hypothetical protein
MKPRTFLPFLILLILTACGGSNIPAGVADVNGLTRVESPAGVMNFVIVSGLTETPLPGARISLINLSGTTLIYADDPTGLHLPLAAPLLGQSTVRRVMLPPHSVTGYNIASATGSINVDILEAQGTLTEADVRGRLQSGPDHAVLIYLYNPASPLALTSAALDVYATPFENVWVLRPGPEDRATETAMLIVGMERKAYETWSNLPVDRYLSARIGKAPDIDLRDDLAFRWSYPVLRVDPDNSTLEMGAQDTATLTLNWRQVSPDPPPPWSLTTGSDSPAVTIAPASLLISPQEPPQTLTVSIHRSGLAVGDYTANVFIQPFSEIFGMIDQRIEISVSFNVGESTPTPTQGPQVQSLTLDPTDPITGDVLKIEALGFAPGESVLTEFSGAKYHFADSVGLADARGLYKISLDLETVDAGDYSLRLRGSQSGVEGSATVTVAARPPDAVVLSNELNVRLEPRPDSPVLEVLVKGDPIDVIAVNGDNSWLEVITAAGTHGWVQTRLVTLNIDLANVPWNSGYPAP